MCCDGRVEMSAVRAAVPAEDLAASIAFSAALGLLGATPLREL